MKTHPKTKETECQKVGVRRDNTAIVFCERCGTRYKVNAGKVKRGGRKSRVKCKQGHSFLVFFEFRENRRRAFFDEGFYRPIKEVVLRGEHRKLPIAEKFEKMHIKNISRTGIGFVIPDGHELKPGDKIEVMFKADDENRSRMERTAIVRRLAEENYLGCEFTDIGCVDKTTGFLLMP
jgi:hypothetical protein